jgi:hypothetical protein
MPVAAPKRASAPAPDAAPAAARPATPPPSAWTINPGQAQYVNDHVDFRLTCGTTQDTVTALFRRPTAKREILVALAEQLQADLGDRIKASKAMPEIKSLLGRLRDLKRQSISANERLQAIEQQKADPALLARSDLGDVLVSLDGQRDVALRQLDAVLAATDHIDGAARKAQAALEGEYAEAARQVLAKHREAAVSRRQALLQQLAQIAGPVLDELAAVETHLGELTADGILPALVPVLPEG